MAVKVITSVSILMQLAKAVADAEKSGDQEAINKAVADHDSYLELCRKADMMTIF